VAELRAVTERLASQQGRAPLSPLAARQFEQAQRAAVGGYRDHFSQDQLNRIQAISMLLRRVTDRDEWSAQAQRTTETWTRIRLNARTLLRGL
jgi:hypothetical protein